MKLHRIGLTAIVTFLATVSAPISLNLRAPFSTTTFQALAQNPDARKAEAGRLYQQGYEQYQTSQFEMALQSWQQALNICHEIKDCQGEGEVLGNMGAAYLSLGNYAKGIEYEQQALAIAKEIHDRQSEGKALGNLGLAYSSLGNYAKGIEYEQQFLAIAREIKDRQSEGQSLGNLGIDYFSLGNYGKAIEYLQQRLTIAQEIKDRRGEENGLGNLGMVYQAIGNYGKTIDYHQQSLAIAKEIKDRLGEGQSLGSLGIAYLALHDYSKGIDYLQQSLAIVQETKNREGEGQALGNLGVAYIGLGNYDKAIKYSQQQLAIGREIHDRHGEGTALGNLGRAYLLLGNYTKAIEYGEQQLAIEREIKDPLQEGGALSIIGYALLLSGNLAASEKNLTNAIQAWESLRAGLGSNDANKVSIFEEQVVSYKLLQKVLIAQNKAKAALEIAERGRARALVELLAARLSPTSSAQLSITPPLAQQIQQIAKAQNATLVEYSIIYDGFKVQGRKQSRESELFIWVIKPTGEAAFRRVDLKPILKNTSLTELAPNSPAVVPAAPISPDLTPTPKSAPELTTPWQQPVAIALFILSTSSIISIAIWGGRFLIAKKAAPNSKLKHRRLVPALLLVLAVGSSGTLFFWMTRSQVNAEDRNPRNNSLLAELVDSTRESIGTKGRGLGIVAIGQKASQGDRLKQLHQILIQPIADLLPTDPNSRVIFIPQSSLFLVPFPALQDESGKYLIEKHTILTAPSIQVLDLTRQQKQRLETIYKLPLQGKDALIVGNPTMPSVPPQIGEPPQQLPSLPGAEEEAKAIAALLKTQAVTGDRATKSAILQKMPSSRIVHLATHGILDDIRGLGSAIALAPSGKDDGLLSAEQILDLKLNAELVVLSACDTGRGKITGDGVVGLSRSLISAGVPSVLVSLWSVPDAPTASLMTEFYRNLQRGLDKAQALRLAMLTTMKQHPNPRDWAAFTLIGEAE